MTVSLKTINLTEDELWLYISCPVQYDLYRKQIIPVKPKTFQEHLQYIARNFFSNLMEGKVLSGAAIKRQWDTLVKKNKDTIPDDKITDGISKLMIMYKWAEKVKLRILDITVPYLLIFKGLEDDTRIFVKGNIPVISVTQGMVPEILALDFGNKHSNTIRIDMNLKYSLHSLAYKQQGRRTAGVHVHNVKFGTDTLSYRGKDDYQRLERTVATVAYCIDKGLYYPRENVMCTQCFCAGSCKAWR